MMNQPLDFSGFEVGDLVSLSCGHPDPFYLSLPTIHDTLKRQNVSYSKTVKLTHSVPLYGLVVGSWRDRYEVTSMYVGQTLIRGSAREISSLAVMTPEGIVLIHDSNSHVRITKEEEEDEDLDILRDWP